MSPAARQLHEQRKATYAMLEAGMRDKRASRNLPNPLVIAPLLIAVALLLGKLFG